MLGVQVKGTWYKVPYTPQAVLTGQEDAGSPAHIDIMGGPFTASQTRYGESQDYNHVVQGSQSH